MLTCNTSGNLETVPFRYMKRASCCVEHACLRSSATGTKAVLDRLSKLLPVSLSSFSLSRK
jgi:hypothetical protein